MIKGIIFDLDGTLIDSMGIWSLVDRKFLENHGKEVPPDISEIVKTMTIKDSSEYFVKRFSLEMTWQEVSEEIQSLVKKEYYENIPLKKGVKELLCCLDEINIPYGIATATYPDMAKAALKRLGIIDRFRFILTQDEVEKGKDEPEIFIKGASLLGIENFCECMVAEDSLHCIETAKKAGFFTAAVYDSASQSKWEKIKNTADISLADISELKKFRNFDYIRPEKLKDNLYVFSSRSHRFGTDAFLLAEFSAPKKKDIVCDLGTGCGIIPLLWQKRSCPAKIYAVDLQRRAIEQLKMGIEKSRIISDIEAVHSDLKELDGKIPFNTADVVVCNPPYKAAGTGIESSTKAQKIARHEIMCTIDDVCSAASKLLKYGGKFCMCSRPERLSDVIYAMKKSGIEPKRLQFVSKEKGGKPWLFLIEGRRGGKPFMNVEKQMYLYENGEMTEEMKKYYE